MAQTNKESSETNAGSFGNLTIEDIEAGLSMDLSGIVGGEGSPMADNDEKEKDNTTKALESTDSTFGGIDISKMIEVPITSEDFQSLSEDTGDSQETAERDDKTTHGGDSKSKPGASKDTGSDTGKDIAITEDSPLYLHAATLHEEGILPTLNLNELKGKTSDEAFEIIMEAQKKYSEDMANEYKNSLSDRQRSYLELIDKGVSDEYAEHQTSLEESYGKVTDEVLADSEDLQKQIIVQFLNLKGLTERQINGFIKNAETDESLFEEAKDARNAINEYISQRREELIEVQKKEEEARLAKEEELKTKIKDTVGSLKEVLPGISISDKERTRLFDLMTKPVGTVTVDGKNVPVNLINQVRSKDRIMFDLRLNYFIELGMFNKDFDMSKLNKKVTSSAAQKLATKLRQEAGGPSGKGVAMGKKKEEAQGGATDKIVFPDFKIL